MNKLDKIKSSIANFFTGATLKTFLMVLGVFLFLGFMIAVTLLVG